MLHPYTNPLVLTTPHMKGKRVVDAQWLLSGHNRFSGEAIPIVTYHGKLDEEYGPDTFAATKRAKFWLGYPLAECNGQFGQTIFEYLRNEQWRPLPYFYRRRRDQRIKAAIQPIGAKALAVALTQVGTKESPADSNMTKYGTWYGMNDVPWCAIFLSWCFGQVGGKFRESYVPYIIDKASRAQGMHFTTTPQPGNLVCYSWSAQQRDAHVEFFMHWVNPGESFMAVGGNTGPRDWSNGGEVAISERYMTTVHKFVRVER